MGIDTKETIAILWKILGFSINTSIKFMRKHPILSGVSMFILVLYIFLPSLLFFLIYSSPVLAYALVYAREKLGLRFSSSYNPFSYLEPKSCEDEKRCHLKQQRSVRRNARMKVEEWDSQTSEEEKDKVILTSLYNDLLGRTPQFEESPKAIETNIVEDNEKFLGEEDTRDVDNVNVERPTVCNCEIKYRDLDGKDEEAKEEMGNVNEHGISEIERNRRLESLIARRRARRLFRLALDQRNKLQAEETTSPKQNNNNNNLQITVPWNNNLEKRRSYPSETNAMGIQIPGSAPSVLLQGRNHFDIPYDPQEERPILTGDSFDQEFSLFNHKDVFFCRHENFCRFAHYPPEHAQCLKSPVPASEISTTIKRLDLDNEYMDHTEQKLSCNEKEATIEDDCKSVESEKCKECKEGEVEMNEETDSNKEESDDDSSCSEESESELNRLNKAELREAICQSMDNNYSGFQMNQPRNTIPNTFPRGFVAPRLDDNNMFYTRRCENSHSRTFSVASDMQVEVSEIGSPPKTVDWLDDWSNGGGSYTYDTDIDREIIRGEESRKKIYQQYDESRSGMESNEENNGPKNEHEAKPDENFLVDDMSLSDRRGQSEEIFEQNTSSSSDVSKPTKGLLFRTSVSLSSITEEPVTILDSIDGGNSENINCLDDVLTDQKPLTTLDSSMKKLIDEEVVDVKNLDNGSPKVIDLNINDHQPKDQILSNIQGEHDTEINMKKSENTEPREYEETQSFLDASLDTPYLESFEREVKEEEEEDVSNFDNFTGEITKQTDDEVHQSDLKISQDHVLTEVLESEVIEENGQELVKNTDEKAEPIEQETPHSVLKASLLDPHMQLSEDYKNAENESYVILMQVEDDNNSTVLDESSDQEISKEGENSELLKDSYDESTQEYNNRVNVEEESIVSTEIQNSQDSQPWTQQLDINSSEGISPKSLEITQELEHEDAIAPNTTISQDIDKDEVIAVAKDSAVSENHNEENLKLYKQVREVMEEDLEVNLKSMYHNIGLHVRGDDEESKQVIRAMQDAETQTTKDENRVLEN